jgi:hypothetical protein
MEVPMYVPEVAPQVITDECANWQREKAQPVTLATHAGPFDTIVGALLVAAIVLAVVLAGWVWGWWDNIIASANAAPPAVVLYQDTHLVREPAGAIVDHPALSEVHACADASGHVASINPFAMTITLLQPCASLFADDFE